jgi:hypothetical protein
MCVESIELIFGRKLCYSMLIDRMWDRLDNSDCKYGSWLPSVTVFVEFVVFRAAR